MSALRGIAVITGAQGVTLTAGIISTGKGLNQNVSHSREADHKFLKNGVGDSVANFITDKKQIFSLSIVPYDPTEFDTAHENYDQFMVAPGLKVTVADSDGSILDGDYLLISSKETRPNDGFCVLDIELQKFDDNNVTVTPGA